MRHEGQNVLVTGGAGFLPSHLVDALVSNGAKVTVLDNLQAGSLDNLQQSWGQIRFMQGDVRDLVTVRAAAEGQHTIYHMAANASVPNSVEDPSYDFHTNVEGTFNVLLAARDLGIKKIVFASSAAVYGEPQYVPIDENHPRNPISPYGGGKLAAENLGFSYARTYGLDFTAIRVFNAFGPRPPRYVIYDLLVKLERNQDHLEVLGTGQEVRDYCYVSDMAQALILVGTSPGTAGQVFNAAGGNLISIAELVLLIRDLRKLPNLQITNTGRSWEGDIRRLVPKIDKIRSIGFAPTIDLMEGIRRMITWFDSRKRGSDL